MLISWALNLVLNHVGQSDKSYRNAKIPSECRRDFVCNKCIMTTAILSKILLCQGHPRLQSWEVHTDRLLGTIAIIK